MFEEETTKKNFEKTQELLVGSPSVQNSSSHQTSISSFDPDSYRADAFNIATLLKADCMAGVEASSTVIEVKPDESSVVVHEKRKSIASDIQSSSQLSQRTNQVEPSTIVHHNDEFANDNHYQSEFCP